MPHFDARQDCLAHVSLDLCMCNIHTVVTNIEQNVLAVWVRDYLNDALPSEEGSIGLVKMVLAAVASNLQLRTSPQTRSLLFGDPHGLDDSSNITVPV